MDFLIDVCTPWYLLFLESWENAAANGLNVYFVEYDNIIMDDAKELCSVMEFLNCTVDIDKMQFIINSVKKDHKHHINFRTGKKGSGKKDLLPHQKDKIRKIGENFSYDLAKFTE